MRAALLCAAVLVSACGTADDADTAADDTATTMTPALATSDLAGTWNFESMPMDADTVVVSGQLVASGEPLALTMHLPGREPQPTTVWVEGDSILTTSDAYESALRPGVMVTTTGIYRMVEGRMVGTVTARYEGVTTADSVTTLRVTMTRQP
jgi:hypothetical protein